MIEPENESAAQYAQKASVLEEMDEKQEIYAIDRDGDLYFVECPACHATDLRRPHLFLCRECGTFFDLFKEDGVKSFRDVKVNYPIHCPGEIKVFTDQQGHHYSPLRWQEDNLLRELGEEWRETHKLQRDLQKDGQDAHGHAKYRRFAVIALD